LRKRREILSFTEKMRDLFFTVEYIKMSKGIIGKKLGMTQVFAEDGSAVGVTAVEVEPSVVLQVKTKDKDGYDAIQLGYGRVKQKNITKPLQGHCDKANKGYFRFIREFPIGTGEYAIGQEMTADVFKMVILSM